MYIELLAPAKDYEHGKAAINHGADAVYIGSPLFGARKQASNSINEIEKIVQYAHLFHSKVYVAFNTLLYDHELDEAQKIIWQLHEIGADALIIQDMGILEMDIPPIEIHASTQMHNIEVDKIAFLEKVGIKRAILARELSIAEIKNIRSKTTIELECFIHGALCVSYSGQCYISHATSNRSGNRGECAQICRTSFSLKDNNGEYLIKNKHLLSLKDLNASSSIEELALAGIRSFKIEGRLKDISYVKNITAHYRKLIDNTIEKHGFKKASSGNVAFTFNPDTEASFSRKFTSYFLNGDRPQMASFDSPKAMGKELGKVTSISQKSISISSQQTINNNDGLCFIDNRGILCGLKVNTVQQNIIYPNEMPKSLTIGTTLYRNSDVAFQRQIESSNQQRTIEIDMRLEESENGILLTIIDEDGLCISLEKTLEKEIAQNPQKSIESIETQLRKTGNSIFTVRSCSLLFNTALYIKLSEINELRRQALEMLQNKRIKTFYPSKSSIEKNDIPYPTKHLDFNANITNKKAREFYQRHGVESIENGFELQNSFIGKTVMTTRYCIQHELGICHKISKQKHSEISFPLWLEGNNHCFKLDFDCKQCHMKVIY